MPKGLHEVIHRGTLVLHTSRSPAVPRMPVLFATILFVACETESATPPSMLAASAAAWNRGDLDGFMRTYLDDSTTTFLTSNGLGQGYAWIRNRYAPWFAPGASRDSLRFTELMVRSLGADHALVTARYVLFRRDSTTATGPFTLVLRRTDTGWKMIHDHTS